LRTSTTPSWRRIAVMGTSTPRSCSHEHQVSTVANDAGSTLLMVRRR
jgi:hypothetical protein